MNPSDFKNGPLSDLRVIEMGTLLAGPFCGQVLGDMGAEVIKVEPPNQGDPMRVWGKEKKNRVKMTIKEKRLDVFIFCEMTKRNSL